MSAKNSGTEMNWKSGIAAPIVTVTLYLLEAKKLTCHMDQSVIVQWLMVKGNCTN